MTSTTDSLIPRTSMLAALSRHSVDALNACCYINEILPSLLTTEPTLLMVYPSCLLFVCPHFKCRQDYE
jgi:hypothetical protein